MGKAQFLAQKINFLQKTAEFIQPFSVHIAILNQGLYQALSPLISKPSYNVSQSHKVHSQS